MPRVGVRPAGRAPVSPACKRRPGTGLAPLALAALCLAASCSRPDPGNGAPEPPREAGAVGAPVAAGDARGGELYGVYCALCHGERGEGYVADDANALANPNFLAAASDAFLRDAIVHGRPGTPMSAWGAEAGGPLAADEVDAIVAHLRGWQQGPAAVLDERPPAGSALRGQGAWAVHCASCHGEGGEGASAVSLSNPWFLSTASDGYLRHAIAEGRPGTPMEAWRGRLPERTIEDLVALIRSWASPPPADPAAGFVPDYDEALLNPGGADPDWTLRDDRYVAADDVRAALDAGRALVIVDARPGSDFVTEHISGSVSVPFYAVEAAIEALPRDAWIVTYCGCPHAVSGEAADALRAAGFERVAVLDEGFYEWRTRGYGTEPGP